MMNGGLYSPDKNPVALFMANNRDSSDRYDVAVEDYCMFGQGCADSTDTYLDNAQGTAPESSLKDEKIIEIDGGSLHTQSANFESNGIAIIEQNMQLEGQSTSENMAKPPDSTKKCTWFGGKYKLPLFIWSIVTIIMVTIAIILTLKCYQMDYLPCIGCPTVDNAAATSDSMGFGNISETVYNTTYEEKSVVNQL